MKAHLVSAAHLHGVARQRRPGQLPGAGPQRRDERRPQQENAAGGCAGSADGRHVPGWRHRAGPRFRVCARAGRASRRGRRDRHGHPSRPNQLQERVAGAGAVPSNAATALYHPARARAGTLQDCSPWKFAWGRIGARRPRAEPRSWPRSGRRVPCSTACAGRPAPTQKRPIPEPSSRGKTTRKASPPHERRHAATTVATAIFSKVKLTRTAGLRRGRWRWPGARGCNTPAAQWLPAAVSPPPASPDRPGARRTTSPP